MSTADVSAARHLEAALRVHRARVERDGGAVPDAVLLLERLARYRVSGSQDGSTFDDSADQLDDQAVTPRLLTYRQVGDALAFSESKVKRLVAAGELQAVRIGGATRIRVGDLDAFVAALGDARSE